MTPAEAWELLVGVIREASTRGALLWTAEHIVMTTAEGQAIGELLPARD